jgi:hypothetical protein
MHLPMCALQIKIRPDVDASKCCIKGRGVQFVMTLGATEMQELFAGNLGASSFLQAVVHATGKEVGIFGWTT